MRFVAVLCVVAAFAVAGYLWWPTEEFGPDFFDDNQSLYSQRKEELVIRHFFRDRRDGFFVDVGSYHWERVSTTAFLEKHLGWSGIAIDAQERFRKGYAKYRPRTQFFSYFVTDHSGTEETLFLADGISSADGDWHKQFPGLEKFEPKAVSIPTITLNELLEAAGISRINFLSMDIEGGEADALAGFDIEKYRPDLVCIEVTGANAKTVEAYFEEHGYRRLTEYIPQDSFNWYFAPR